MARNKVMKLWNAIVTAFLALCTALGLITTTASAAVPQTDKTRNSDSTPNMSAPTTPLRPRSLARALPPTMKQRIHAEAHGKSPSCRHRPLSDTTAESGSADCSDDTTSPRTEPAAGRIPLQR
ncbi:DUF6344 domain-containing protein [Streptomyces sp. NRRL S-37]|uniref:DUF6344 domain-containing protein n=1 Tax=Streptomyces sp. NRRL S-37 TaxID=1463903 RepID=UPI0004C9A7A5|nr:DUF6344 domain-containing protein [Streptomyces sp. NRRL S-37]